MVSPLYLHVLYLRIQLQMEIFCKKQIHKILKAKLEFAAPATIYIAFALNLQLFPQHVHFIRDYMSRNDLKHVRGCA